MKIRSIELTNLFKHEHSVVELPDAGVVVVQGPNGAGKSGLIEAVPTAIWGKTLRGTAPWLDGAKSEAAVGIAGVADLGVIRSKTPSDSPQLKWFMEHEPEEDTTFPTTTKAQEKLDEHIEPFDVWKRAHAFSSEDRAHFSRATDKERKQLIETLVGAGGSFDSALAKCRKDLKAARSSEQSCDVEIARLEASLDAEKRRQSDHEVTRSNALRSIEELADDGIVEEPLGDLEEELEEVTDQYTLLSSKASAIDRQVIDCDNEAGNARRRVEAIEAGECPTCGQAVEEALRDALRGKAAALKEIADEERASGHDAKEEIAAKLRKLLDRKRDLEQRVRSVSNACSQLEIKERNRGQWRKQAEQAEASIAECARTIRRDTVELEGARDEQLLQSEEVAVLEACERVLGVKGVRAAVLGKALGGIEAVANAWLSRLACEGLKVRLSPCREMKGGGITDEVALDVEGAGGGYGYRAASGGERRRIDVALLLAMAEVAAAGHGSTGSTLFFDEVFDCLDAEGTAAVARALEDLAADRAVVVVTHSRRLAEELSAVRRLHVEGGVVVEQ